MANEIDSLEVSVKAQAQQANAQLDKLIGKLNQVSGSLNNVNASGLSGLAGGIKKFAEAAGMLSNVKTADFTRLTKNIMSLSSMNTAQMYNSSSAITMLTKSLNTIGSVSQNALQFAEVAKSVSKLGGVMVQRAITNMPLLATAINNLMTTLSTAPTVSDNVTKLTNALADLASNGTKVGAASKAVNNSLKSYSSHTSTARKHTLSLSSTIGKLYQTYYWLIKIKFKTQLFKKTVKPDDETQVFTKEEELLLTDLAFTKYRTNNNILYLMIPLFFLTGMRLGELAALKFEDVHKNYILVHQMYGRQAVMGDDGKWDTSRYEVVDKLKLNAEPRKVKITPDVKTVINKIKAFYWQCGNKSQEYLFIDKKGQIPSQATVDRMFYRMCDSLGILRRSPHKVRKTYISTLIDGGLNLNFICEQVGHEDERTTLSNYCFNRKNEEQTIEQLRIALAK